MRLATWNLKQAVAPKKPAADLWQWIGDTVEPDVVVFTEAKVPNETPPAGWQAVWIPGGFGPRRRWGTVIAGRGVQVTAVTSVTTGPSAGGTIALEPRWPAAAVVADITVGSERWATVVGLYGLTVDTNGDSCSHGRYSVPALLNDLEPLFTSDRADRIIVAGDFNMWPSDTWSIAADFELVDCVSLTAADRPVLAGCTGCDEGDQCGHLWTHRNGNSPNAAVQQIDFIFATPTLAGELDTVYGGPDTYPGIWDLSDHAPVVAEFS